MFVAVVNLALLVEFCIDFLMVSKHHCRKLVAYATLVRSDFVGSDDFEIDMEQDFSYVNEMCNLVERLARLAKSRRGNVGLTASPPPVVCIYALLAFRYQYRCGIKTSKR